MLKDPKMLQTSEGKLLKIRGVCYDYLVKNRNMYIVLSCLIKECIKCEIVNETNIIYVLNQFAYTREV